MNTWSVAVTFVKKRTPTPFEFIKGQFHATTTGTKVLYFVDKPKAIEYMNNMLEHHAFGIYSIVLAEVHFAQGGTTSTQGKQE